ncbi:hypothetical protein GH714_005482 [Hevea brasiliensis]|uniref:Two-component response regulator n=1 Tax=Hevea brasiliensis TaxID=3981 RepID=A0A6A6MBT5_HEVBR|nr:hypothetical protein GH714_005482 [Hevea brasiliensis]
MTVEDKKCGLVNEDKFPVGMSILAVDDDPICLKVLENLLRKCQYQVLSAHSDKELVYKGVTHGAVDYLLKPVRIEELKNIWQHVIRRKKSQPKDQKRSPNQDKPVDGVEGGQGVSSSGSADQNGKVNRKRKDQDEDEEEEGEENLHENEEPGTQKKPRVVWSVELHRKFVAAVNQLGLDKAVPKKILDLMNVEGLTRENVASHLQKYRLYLKRISSVASQQANMVAAFGGKDSSYLRMGSLDGFGDFRTLSGPGRLSSTSISYSPGGMLGRLNSPAGLALRSIASSGLLQSGHSQTLNSAVNTLGKLQPSLLPASQGANLLQGVPLSMEPNQLQGKSNTHIGEYNHNDDTAGFTLATSFSDARVTIGSLNNTVPSPASNPLMLQVNPQQSQSRGAFATQSSLSVPSLYQESFDVGVHGSSNFLDHSRCTENWQGAVQLSKFQTNSLPLSEPFSHDPLSSSNLRGNISSTSSQIGNSPNDFSSSSVLATPLDSRVDMEGQTDLIGNIVQNTSYNSRQRWEEHSQDYNPNLNNSFSTINTMVSGNGGVGSLSHSMDQRKKFDMPLAGQLNSVTPCIFQHAEAEKSAFDPKMRPNENYLLEQTKSQNGFAQNNYDSLDDIMNAMIKRV